MDVLKKASQDLTSALKAYPMVLDINDGFMPGKQQIDFSILPQGRSLGLTSKEVARQIEIPLWS